MRITDVRVRMIQNSESKLKATCSVVIDDAFVVHDLRVVQGANGIFVAMPQRKMGDGQYRDLAHPITAAAREYVQRAVLAAYYKAGFAELGESASLAEVPAQDAPQTQEDRRAEQQAELRESLQDGHQEDLQESRHEDIQENLPEAVEPALHETPCEPAPAPAVSAIA